MLPPFLALAFTRTDVLAGRGPIATRERVTRAPSVRLGRRHGPTDDAVLTPSAEGLHPSETSPAMKGPLTYSATTR